MMPEKTGVDEHKLNLAESITIAPFELRAVETVDIEMDVPEGKYPEGLYYSRDHAWIKVEGNNVRMGITDCFQKFMGDILYALLPNVQDVVKQGERYGTLESIKNYCGLKSAVSGIIEEVNSEVENTPDLLNTNPYGGGWLVVVKPSNLRAELHSLMDFTKATEWNANLVDLAKMVKWRKNI